MARYFIDFRDDDHLTTDGEGGDYADVAQAQADAVAVLRQAVKDGLPPESGRSLASLVRDEAGDGGFTATFEFRCTLGTHAGPSGRGGAALTG